MNIQRYVLMPILLLLAAESLAEVPYLRCFTIASQQHNVPLETLIGIARVESNFQAGARSPADAHGIMQIRWPLTARHLGIRRVAELYNPCINIDAGAAYFSELTRRYNGNRTLALAAYNYGPSRITSVSDVPPRVMAYVRRVQAAEPKLSRSPAAATVELNRFGSLALAERYTRTLMRHAPDITLRLQPVKGAFRVLLDTASLSYGDRVRLGRLTGISIGQHATNTSFPKEDPS
jgi:soluble lytic murein transglycosylase-like protein